MNLFINVKTKLGYCYQVLLVLYSCSNKGISMFGCQGFVAKYIFFKPESSQGALQLIWLVLLNLLWIGSSWVSSSLFFVAYSSVLKQKSFIINVNKHF